MCLIFFSSDEDIDAILRNSLNQKSPLKQDGRSRMQEDSSEDEFEKQMDSELKSTMKLVEAVHSVGNILLSYSLRGQSEFTSG